MPRFFFHEIDGALKCDREGVELPDRAAARQEAIRLLGALLADEPGLLGRDGQFRLQVASPAGTILFTVSALAVETTHAA